MPEPRSQQRAVSLQAPASVMAGDLARFKIELALDEVEQGQAHQVEVVDQQLGAPLLLTTALPTAAGDGSYEGTWRPTVDDEGPYLLRAKVVHADGRVQTSEQVTMEVRVVEPFARKGPSGLLAVAQAGGVKLSWNAFKGATGYHVYRAGAPGVQAVASSRLATTTTPSYADTAVQSGATYYYVVTSYTLNKRNNRTRESAASAEVKATVGGASSDTTPPTVTISWPTADATYTAAKTVTIVAHASDDVGVVKVAFYDGATLKHTASTAPYSYAWSFTAADNGSHGWTAKAFDAAGNSAVSTPRVLKVQIATGPTKPAAPTGVKAVAAVGKNTVSWSPVSGASGYNLYWATTSGVTPQSGKQVAGVASPYAHLGLVNGVTYYYVVTAFNAAGEGPPSAQVSAKPQAAPDTTPPTFGGLSSATALSTSQVKLGWSPASDNVTAAGGIVYEIYRSTGSSFSYGSPQHTTSAGATSYTVSGLSAGTTYNFVVRARDAAGNTDTNTAVRSATTDSSPPTGPTPPFGSTTGVTAANFTVTDCGTTQFSLHAQYNKHPAVVLLFNWTGFT